MLLHDNKGIQYLCLLFSPCYFIEVSPIHSFCQKFYMPVYVRWKLDHHAQEILLLFLLSLALQLAVGFGLSNNTSPFFPIYHQLSPSSHCQHLKISFYFFSPSFPGSSSSSHPFQFLSEDLFGHPVLLHSLRVTQPTYPLPLDPFYFIAQEIPW